MRGDEDVAMSFKHELSRALSLVVAEQVTICFRVYRRDPIQLDKPKMRLVMWQHELRFHAVGSTALSQPVNLEYQKKIPIGWDVSHAVGAWLDRRCELSVKPEVSNSGFADASTSITRSTSTSVL